MTTRQVLSPAMTRAFVTRKSLTGYETLFRKSEWLFSCDTAVNCLLGDTPEIPSFCLVGVVTFSDQTERQICRPIHCILTHMYTDYDDCSLKRIRLFYAKLSYTYNLCFYSYMFFVAGSSCTHCSRWTLLFFTSIYYRVNVTWVLLRCVNWLKCEVIQTKHIST